MAGLQMPMRGGNRGGKELFKWEDVKTDKHRDVRHDSVFSHDRTILVHLSMLPLVVGRKVGTLCGMRLCSFLV